MKLLFCALLTSTFLDVGVSAYVPAYCWHACFDQYTLQLSCKGVTYLLGVALLLSLCCA